MGGGKTLDTAKLAANQLGLPYIALPTSASTDAPASSMAVLYLENGRHQRCVTFDHGPALVLVDSLIISKAPLRLFVAGIGDALATCYEARANAASDTANYIGTGYRRCQAGLAIAESCGRVLWDYAESATADLSRGLLTEAVENVIEANILLSGLGFENTGCAAAHAVHTGLHEIPGAEASHHGEMVAFGVIFQLVMEKAPAEEIEKVIAFLSRLGLPTSLGQLGVEASEENLSAITARIIDGNSGVEAEPFPVDAALVRASLLQADALGRRTLKALAG
jgi:glycerol dehydrogenase